MSPTRTSPDGSYRLAWQRREVGRITSSSGTHTVKGWRAAMALLDQLYERNELDVLRALKAGEVTMKEVVAAEKARAFGRGDALHILTLRRPLWPAVDAWLGSRDDATTNTYRYSLNKLRATGVLAAQARIADLQSIDWPALRDAQVEGEQLYRSAANWNHLRRAISRFLTIALGDVYHPVRRAIIKAIPLEKERARRVTLTPAEFWRLIAAADELLRPAFVTLAVTGMRLGEYERATPAHVHADQGTVDVQGSKTEGSSATVRVGPSLIAWVVAGIPMRIPRRALQARFKAAAVAIGRPELRIHDLRHCTAIFALQEGAPINAVRDLMRHEGTSQTLDYTRSSNVDVAAAAIERALAPDAPLHRNLHSEAPTTRVPKQA